MKKIVFLCSMGISSSILVHKAAMAAMQSKYSCQIEAYALQAAKEKAADADCIFIAPSIQASRAWLEQVCPGIPIEEIAPETWSRLDGQNLLQTAVQTMNQKTAGRQKAASSQGSI